MISFLFAYRNRDSKRVLLSLKSLALQEHENFEVVFVDYGSDDDKASAVKKLVESFAFSSYYYIAHPGLLWNKSKALNYAASKAKGDYVFVADVDICFNNKVVKMLQDYRQPGTYSLFKLSYLKEQAEPLKLKEINALDKDIKHHGSVNGMVLVRKDNFFKIEGYDEFYHFYGSEDVDFYLRLRHLGLKEQTNSDTLFYHQWHSIYNTINDSVFEQTPRLFNIKKINQQHFINHQESKAIQPSLIQKVNQQVWEKEDEPTEQMVTKKMRITNDHAKVWHTLKIRLPNFENGIVELRVEEEAYFKSAKYKLKKLLRKPDRVSMTMKAVNDMILEEILLNYRHHNYSYKISEDLKVIVFILAK